MSTIKEYNRGKTLLLLFCVPLALLGLLIWTNPYGREISSSLPAIGILPVVIALLAASLSRPREIVRLWSTDKWLLAALFLLTSLLFVFLWLAEHSTFYIVVILTALLAIAWLVGKRLTLSWLALLSLLSLGLIILGTGGVFPTPGPDAPLWVRSGLPISAALAAALAIFLPAALLYTVLQGEGVLHRRRLALTLVLAAVLTGASAFLVFWDGVWSAAHARAFEDHLPFAQFLLSLMAGVLLALSLRGRRRLAGLAFVFLVTAVSILALIWGWNSSAFELTRRRAARIDQAIAIFQQDSGRYPTSLGELTPRYLLFLSPPVVVRNGNWCYQGGEDFYRLGYVSGRFTYFEADFQVEVYAQTGDLPPGSWICDRWVAGYEAGELNY